MAKSRVDAVVVTQDGEFAANFKTIATLAAGIKLPSIGSKEYAEAGGLLGYGVNLLSLYRRAAYFVDLISGALGPPICRWSSRPSSNWSSTSRPQKQSGLQSPIRSCRAPTK